jgi:spermidine/putrescine transport system permease protein
VAFTTVAAPSGTPSSQPQEAAPTARRGRWTPYLLLIPGLLWLVLFFAVPLFALAGQSTQTRPPGAELGVYEQTLTFSNYWEALKIYYPQFLRSFLYSSVATLLAFAIGYPLAYAIAFKAGRWRNLLLVLVIAPFFTSFILRTIAWKQILADESTVVSFLQTINLLADDGRLLGTSVAVVAGLTYNFLPFMTLPIYASLERVDPRLIEASGDLYANGWTGFRKVTFPLSLPGVVAGTLLTFIPATGDYVNAALLGSPSTTMIGNVVDSRFFRVVDYPTAAALSFMLMLSILIIVVIYIRRAGTDELV